MTTEEFKDDEIEIDLIELFVTVFEKRWFVVKTAAVFAVCAVIYSLCATCIYESTLNFMPTESSSASGAKAMLAASGMADMLGIGFKTQGETIVGLMQSAAVKDIVIDENDLLTPKDDGGFHPIKALLSSFGSGDKSEDDKLIREDVRKELEQKISVASDTKSGIITLSVKDKSPDVAVQLANSFFDATQTVLQKVALSPSAQRRVFLEEQLKQASAELSKAEKKFMEFQKRTGVMVAGSSTSDIEALAKLQSEMLAKEIELKAALKFGTEKNPKVKGLRAQYDAIKRQFEADKAHIGRVPLSGTGIDKLPEASFEAASLFRDYKFREKLYQLLVSQYENARMNESDTPTIIQKIGEPTYPERKASPKRGKICIAVTFLGGFIGVIIASFGYFKSLMGDESIDRLKTVKDGLNSDLKFFKRRKK